MSVGEAKRRGTFEQRKEQGIARRQAEEAAAAEERARIRAQERMRASERQKLLGPQARREAVLATGGTHLHAMLMAAAFGGALAAPSPDPIIVFEKRDD
jgi:hypothetical protein